MEASLGGNGSVRYTERVLGSKNFGRTLPFSSARRAQDSERRTNNLPWLKETSDHLSAYAPSGRSPVAATVKASTVLP
jgi:hypothetical protein